MSAQWEKLFRFDDNTDSRRKGPFSCWEDDTVGLEASGPVDAVEAMAEN